MFRLVASICVSSSAVAASSNLLSIVFFAAHLCHRIGRSNPNNERWFCLKDEAPPIPTNQNKSMISMFSCVPVVLMLIVCGYAVCLLRQVYKPKCRQTDVQKTADIGLTRRAPANMRPRIWSVWVKAETFNRHFLRNKC